MQSFTLAAIAAVAVNAEYQSFKVTYDDVEETLYFNSQEWSSATVSADMTAASISGNNNVFLKFEPWDGMDWRWTPSLLGGSVSYNVDLSAVPCGCVAGVYAIASSSAACGEGSMATSNPMCQSIDIMQANSVGLQTAGNPCRNGTCDAISQCQYNMAEILNNAYGSDSYGPGGSSIDTNAPFNHKTEFVSQNDYTDLYALRTTLTQNGSAFTVTANCGDYLSMLSSNLDGNMGFAFSTWDNRDGAIQSVDVEYG